MRKIIFVSIALFTSLFICAQEKPPGFYVKGRFIYDKCDERFLVRGVNKMFVWNDPQGNTIPEIAKTGANAIRIVWLADAEKNQNSLSNLDAIIRKCLDHGIVPIPECHDATCENWNQLPRVIEWWTSPEVVQLIEKYQESLIVNLANEPGKNTEADVWFETYKNALLQIRSAGIKVPIMIDADQCGQNINRLQEMGKDLLQADPLKNVLFSAHIYWTGREYAKQLITTEIDECASLDFPIIIGEFAHQAWDGSPLDYKTLLRKCDENQIGWIAWSWGPGNENADLDMTKDGRFITLHDWGLNVAVFNDHGLQNTSSKSYYLSRNSCEIDAAGVKIVSRFYEMALGSKQIIKVGHPVLVKSKIKVSVYNQDTLLFADEQTINPNKNSNETEFIISVADSAKPGKYNIRATLHDKDDQVVSLDSMPVLIVNKLTKAKINLALSSPTPDLPLFESDNVHFQLSYHDSEKQIDHVTYFLNGDSVSSVYNKPYEFYNYNIRRGKFNVCARATDFNQRYYFSDTLKFQVGKKVDVKNYLEIVDCPSHIDSVLSSYPVKMYVSAEQDANIVYGLFDQKGLNYGGGNVEVKMGESKRLDLEINLTENPTPGQTHFWRLQLIPEDGIVRATENRDVKVRIPFKEFYYNPNSQKIIAYSNPNSNRLIIRNTAPNIEMHNLQIMNLYGEIYVNQKIEERNDIFVLNLNTIPYDKYIILIDTNKGIVQKNIVNEEQKGR